jgi:hypothetical protein
MPNMRKKKGSSLMLMMLIEIETASIQITS